MLASSFAILMLCPLPVGFAAPPPPPPPPYGVEWDTPPDLATLGTEPQGSAALSKSVFTVQTKDTVDYVYTVGEGGMVVGDYVRVEDPWGHGIRWSKYGSPQVDAETCTPLAEETDQSSKSLVSVSTTGGASVQIERSTISSDLHIYAYTDAYVQAGDLVEGDTITLRFGDTSTYEDCAHQFSDRAYADWQWRAFENIGGAFTPVTPYPEHHVVAEREPAMLWVSGPSFAQADELIVVKVAVLDRLGNPIDAWGETATLEAAYGGQGQEFDEENGGWLDFGVRISDAGVHRVEVTAGEFTVSSNPIVITKDAPERRLYWGDLHSHHGHTIQYDDGTSLDENHVYARDVLGHDLGCESVKMNPIEIDGANLWEEVQTNCAEVSEEGRYLAMLGTEWMGNYLGSGDGHHNVYFDDCTGFYGDHEVIPALGGTGGLLELLHDLESSQSTRSVVVPHAMPQTGKNWDEFDYDLRAGAEIYSEWGNTVDCPECNEGEVAGSIARGLSRGHRFGFIAATDNHDGWFGNPLSFKYELAGLAGFWAPDLTRADVFDALATRQTLATTGARVIVQFEAIEGDSTIGAGGEYVARSPTFAWEVHGTGTLSGILVQAVPLGTDPDEPEDLNRTSPVSLDAEGQFSWSGWDGSDYAVFLSVTQEDGEQAWSSPIWITQSCDSEYASDPEGYCEGDTGNDTGPIEDTDDTDGKDTADTSDTSASGDTADSIPNGRHPCSCAAGGLVSTGFMLIGLVTVGAALRRRED